MAAISTGRREFRGLGQRRPPAVGPPKAWEGMSAPVLDESTKTGSGCANLKGFTIRSISLRNSRNGSAAIGRVSRGSDSYGGRYFRFACIRSACANWAQRCSAARPMRETLFSRSLRAGRVPRLSS